MESKMSLQNDTNSFDPTVTHDDFLDQMLSGLQTTVSWPGISAGQTKSPLPWDVDQFDDHSTFLSSKLRQHQITTPSSAVKSSRGQNDNIDNSPIGDNGSIQNLFHGFTGSLNQTQQFRSLPGQNFGSPAAAAAVMNASTGGGAPSQPRQRVRARRGQATDPHSIAERLRRERIAERMKALQELVPNANKTDKASMLDEIIDYVKFLQLQVKVLSMSRLGGAAAAAGAGAGAVAPIVTEGQPSGGGAGNDNETMENQVVKLMEEDMGSAMQYLQGKGLCLMPISLATAISTATSSRTNLPLGPSSPNMSVLTVQSANVSVIH